MFRLSLGKLLLGANIFFANFSPASCKEKDKLTLKDSESCTKNPGPAEKDLKPNDSKFIKAMQKLNSECPVLTSAPIKIATKIIYLDQFSKDEELAGLRLIKDNMAALVLEGIVIVKRHASVVTGYKDLERFVKFLESVTKTYSNSKLVASFLRKFKRILKKTKLLKTKKSDIELTLRYRFQRNVEEPHVHTIYDEINGRPVKVNGEIIFGLGDPPTKFLTGNFSLSPDPGRFTHSSYVRPHHFKNINLDSGEIFASHYCYPHLTPPGLGPQNPTGGILMSFSIVEYLDLGENLCHFLKK